jgi:hypothetical protein
LANSTFRLQIQYSLWPIAAGCRLIADAIRSHYNRKKCHPEATPRDLHLSKKAKLPRKTVAFQRSQLSKRPNDERLTPELHRTGEAGFETTDQ